MISNEKTLQNTMSQHASRVCAAILSIDPEDIFLETRKRLYKES